MDCVDGFDELDEDSPDVFLSEVGSFFLVVEYLFEEISSISILHYDAISGIEVPKAVTVGIVEGLLVGDDVGMTEGGQNSDLVDCILDFFLGFVIQFDCFEGIYALIFEPANFEDIGGELGDYLEIGEGHIFFILLISSSIYSLNYHSFFYPSSGFFSSSFFSSYFYFYSFASCRLNSYKLI